MNIEALLKLKCQQALAQGDYDSLKLYSDQLSMHKDGMLAAELPIHDSWRCACNAEAWFQHKEDQESFHKFEQALIDLYGEDLYLVCKSFMIDWNSPFFDEAIRE